MATSSSGSSAPPSSKAPSSCPVAAGTKESAYKVIQDTKRDLTNEELQEYCSKLFKFKVKCVVCEDHRFSWHLYLHFNYLVCNTFYSFYLLKM